MNLATESEACHIILNMTFIICRSTLVVLGLVQESQASGQAQASQSQAAETGSSAADGAQEVTQESASVS